MTSGALLLGGQNCARTGDGAFTGEVSARMLADAGCSFVLVGHSERRTLYGERDAEVAEKTALALAAGLSPVVCVGETLDEREAGRTEATVTRQLDAVIEHLDREALARVVFAYEPVWAIGTGRTATPAQANEVHAVLRARMAEPRFGGGGRGSDPLRRQRQAGQCGGRCLPSPRSTADSSAARHSMPGSSSTSAGRQAEMQQILLIVQILLCVAMVVIVLLQQGSRGGRRGVVRRRFLGVAVRRAGSGVLPVPADRGAGRPVLREQLGFGVYFGSVGRAPERHGACAGGSGDLRAGRERRTCRGCRIQGVRTRRTCRTCRRRRRSSKRLQPKWWNLVDTLS